MEKYEAVLKLMQEKPAGRVELTDPDLNTLLGRLIYRLPTYMSCIRRLAKIEVKAIRNGRKVIAYELTALAPTDAESSEAPAAETKNSNPATV